MRVNNQLVADRFIESDKNYRLLFENNSSINLAIDPETGQIMDANLAATKFYGYSRQEMLNMNIDEINILFNDQLKYEMNAALSGMKNYFLFKHKKSNGQVYDVESYITPLNINGKSIIYSCINDITERKKAEKELLESKVLLSEANATKDRFFSIIGHDLKSPFQGVVGFSQILLEQISEKKYDEIENFARIILDSSIRAMNLLTNLLEWSQTQTGRIEFNPECIELIAIVNEIVDLLNDTAHQKFISILNKLPHDFTVVADRNMVKTILRNLLSNAIKFSNPGGEIVIGLELNEDEMILYVADNGVGIKNGNIDNLFRIDNRHSTLGTNKETGTGLGLVLCKEFTDMHGGNIWAECNGTTGCTFKFSIPSKLKC